MNESFRGVGIWTAGATLWDKQATAEMWAAVPTERPKTDGDLESGPTEPLKTDDDESSAVHHQRAMPHLKYLSFYDRYTADPTLPAPSLTSTHANM